MAPSSSRKYIRRSYGYQIIKYNSNIKMENKIENFIKITQFSTETGGLETLLRNRAAEVQRSLNGPNKKKNKKKWGKNFDADRFQSLDTTCCELDIIITQLRLGICRFDKKITSFRSLLINNWSRGELEDASEPLRPHQEGHLRVDEERL